MYNIRDDDKVPDNLKVHHHLFPWAAYVALVSTFCSLPFTILAQDESYERYKIQEVTSEDFSIESDLIDTDSKAIYLYDLGESNLDIDHSGVALEFSRSFRIKILSEKGLDIANQIIQLYVGRTDKEKIGKVKGGVYNLVDGKVDFEKLKSSDWSIELYSENTHLVRVAFRNVRVGSIIELDYNLYSPFVFNMPDWDFQYDDIPVLYSEYYIRYPEKIGYKILQLGYHPLYAQMITTESLAHSSQGIETNYIVKQVYALACKNVPPMRKEPLMDSPENYRAKVLTELHYFDRSNYREFFYKDWEGAINDFLEEGSNALYMDPRAKDDYLTLDNFDCQNLKDSVRVIYTELLKQFSNSEEQNSLVVRKKPQDLMDSKKATPNEINLLLVSSLRANGIEAYPVLVTKRSQQRVIKEFALFSQFSSCIAVVKTNDGYVLLDATSSHLAPGEISEQYYNGDGLIVNKEKVEWLPITSAEPTTESSYINFSSFEENELKGELRLKLTGIYRNRINAVLRHSDSSNLAEYMDVDKNATITFNKEKSDLSSSPLDLWFDITLKLEKFGDSYLLPSIVYKSMANNVLKGKARTYPVNFPDTWSESYTCMINLDSEKYDIILPEMVNIVLPDGDGKFSYMASYNLSNLLIRSKVDLNKNTFVASEYPVIRQFYDLISTTHSSFIEITEK